MRGLPISVAALYGLGLRAEAPRSPAQRACVVAVAELAYGGDLPAAVSALRASCCDRCDVLCASGTALLVRILEDEIAQRRG